MKPTVNQYPIKPPKWILAMYALGQMGWALASYGVATVLIYYYMSPTDGTTAPFPTYIYQGLVLGVATVIGLVSFGGRILDAFTDPLIAAWSDRSNAKFGRRRTFMGIAFIPFALFSFLVFMPLTQEASTLNAIWLVLVISLFYFFLTLYVTPYNALISELGHTPNERLTISTLISVTYALGYGVGSSVMALYPLFMEHFDMEAAVAFRSVMGVFAILAAILMALPVIFVNEKKYCVQAPSEESLMSSIKLVMSNRNFRMFALSDFMYWLAFTFIQMGVAYYVTVLLQMEVGMASVFLMGMLLCSFLLYIPINIAARKWGKKRLMLGAFIGFLGLFSLVFFLGKMPFTNMQQLLLIGALSVGPIAIFGILPNAIIADIIDVDGQRTGSYKAGMFFAVRTFISKLGISTANLIFPSILAFGYSVNNDLGVRLTGVVAVVFCLIGMVCFFLYKEETVEDVTKD